MQIPSDSIFVIVKKNTVDYLRTYLESRGITSTTYDDIIQEWVNWQKKADDEPEPRHTLTKQELHQAKQKLEHLEMRDMY